WTGTALIPEKDQKDVGLGLTLPLYVSGPHSVGYWGVFIMMLADLTAFASLVFGYFFFWTIHEDFPPPGARGPGVLWPALGLAGVVGAWALTVAARACNQRDKAFGYYVSLVVSWMLAAAGAAALIYGPVSTQLDPTAHCYQATVWMLVLWSVLHIGIGVIMQGYCFLRRLAGRMTSRYDIDIRNVTLYWHFTLLTVLLTVLVIAGFPLASRGAG
ncbi:MAG: cytochrome ubiquinol oxidase subunit I, partial [Polyangiales bacterium]